METVAHHKLEGRDCSPPQSPAALSRPARAGPHRQKARLRPAGRPERGRTDAAVAAYVHYSYYYYHYYYSSSYYYYSYYCYYYYNYYNNYSNYYGSCYYYDYDYYYYYYVSAVVDFASQGRFFCSVSFVWPGAQGPISIREAGAADVPFGTSLILCTAYIVNEILIIDNLISD